MFTDKRIVLISDSMMATGMEDGQYELGGQPVTVVGNLATLTEGGAIAGSATNLMDCMRTVVKEMHIPFESAIQCATLNPAKSIGIDDKYAYLSSIPMDFAGFKVAHWIALSNGICISLTTVLIQSIKFVAEPAMAPPSVSVARFPTTVTGCPPNSYCPSSIPVAIILSLISTILLSVNISNVALTQDG